MGKNKFVEIGLSHSIRSHVINISNSVEMPEQRNYFRTNRPGPIIKFNKFNKSNREDASRHS